MGAFLGVVSVFVMFICVVWLLVNLVVRKKITKPLTWLCLGFALFVAALGMPAPAPPEGNGEITGRPAAGQPPGEAMDPAEDRPPAAPATPQPPLSPEAPAADPAATPAFQVLSARVMSVTDGDTIRVRLDYGQQEEAIRLIGVDTPESTREVEPFGREAAAFTARHLEGESVYLELDINERDRFGRVLAYVWLSMPIDGSKPEVRAKMFNARLLTEGYAEVMTIPPNVKYADLFLELQREARDAGAGLWGAAAAVPAAPADEAAAYIGNARTLRFHRPACRWAAEISPANRVEIKTRHQAVRAGFEPCKVCDP